MLDVDSVAHSGGWQRFHAAEKACFGLGCLGVALLAPAPGGGLVVAVAVLLLITIGPARVAPRLLLRLGLPALGSVAVSAIVVLVDWGAGPPSAAGSRVEAAAALTGRSTGAVACLLFLGTTIPIGQWAAGSRAVGIPDPIVEVGLAIHRTIVVGAGLVGSLDRAARARLGYRDARTALRTAGLVGGGLLGRLYDRDVRHDRAVAARRGTGEPPVARIGPPSPVRLSAAVMGVLVVALASWTVVR